MHHMDGIANHFPAKMH